MFRKRPHLEGIKSLHVTASVIVWLRFDLAQFLVGTA
jgi:hypothetical protein